jgi:DnaK suppressor protein
VTGGAQRQHDDRDDARRRLESEREVTLRRLANLTEDFDAVVAASRDTNADDEHDPEGTTIAFERSQVASLVRHAEGHLLEIDSAFRRLDEGTYGSCESCGAPIGVGRLEARPVARSCIRCAGGARAGTTDRRR